MRLAGLLAFCFGTATMLAASELAPLAEHQLKALYLFNFTKYVDWPVTAFESTNSCYTIGIAASDETYDDLAGIANSKTANGRRLVIKRLERPADAKACHIVYFSRGNEKLAADTLEVLHSAPVLTIGDQDDFLSRGGMVRFTREENKLRLEINLEASQAAHLTVSARLLPVAKVIRGLPSKEN